MADFEITDIYINEECTKVAIVIDEGDTDIVEFTASMEDTASIVSVGDEYRRLGP